MGVNVQETEILGRAEILRRATAPFGSPFRFGDGDCGPRVMLVYAHPDDEGIAVGGRFPVFAEALFLQVTDGAPADNADGARLGMTRETYRAARVAELTAAFVAGGLGLAMGDSALPVDGLTLPVDGPALPVNRSALPLNRSALPVNRPASCEGRPAGARHECLGVVDKEASLDLVGLTREVGERLAREGAEVVLTHPYEGGHADHDACAFAVHAACALRRRAGWTVPVVAESPFYFRRGDGALVTGEFALPGVGAPVAYVLEEAERARKRAVLGAFRTQAGVLRVFGTERECYRVAPRYDFTRPAQEWPAHYESFMAGMTAEGFSGRAAAALKELGLSAGDGGRAPAAGAMSASAAGAGSAFAAGAGSAFAVGAVAAVGAGAVSAWG